ncbi:MAG TPA: DinB family protein [Terriglobia bacterium]|nr:DinB family protein [Terriglobia bacterium]
MRQLDVLLQEFDMEMAGTRKSLERIPAKFSWKPHDKSMSLGQLAIHLAEIPGWAQITLGADEFDVSPVGGPPHQPPALKTRDEVVALFDKNLESARRAFAEAKDEDLMKPWSLKAGGKELMTMPRAAVLRGFVLSHNIHHRAQLGVYLRMNNVPVPSIYGPSADENNLG